MNKKTIIYFLILLLVAGGTGYYYWFFRSSGAHPSSGGAGTLSDISGFLPVGGNYPAASTTGEAGGQEPSSIVRNPSSQNGGVTTYAAGKLKRLTNVAISGASLAVSSTGSTSVVYLEKQSGHLYQLAPDNQPRRLTNTTLPGIEEVFWGQDKKGPRLIVRYLKAGAIQNFSASANLPKSTSPTPTEGSLTGFFLSGQVSGLAVSPSGNKIFSLSLNNGVAHGIISDFDFAQPAEIFTSQFTDWQISWPELGTITLLTKPSYAATGYLYFLPASGGRERLVINGVDGLTTKISPDAKLVAYTGSSGKLNVLSAADGKIKPVLLSTIADKCVWTRNSAKLFCFVPNNSYAGNLPDDWYSGQTVFDDNIYEIDPGTGNNFITYNSREAGSGISIDGEAPFLDRTGGTIYFTNKNDGSLWSFDLKKDF